MGIHEGCRLPTPSQAHCSVCHRTFSGVWGFDQHRKDGKCLDPVTVGFAERDGVWRYRLGKRPEHWR